MPRIPENKMKVVKLCLEPEVDAFYRKRAKESGLSLSAYLRQLLLQGTVAITAEEIEEKIKNILPENLAMMDKNSGGLSEKAFMNIFYSVCICEGILTAMLEERDVNTLYKIQEAAKKKAKKLQEAGEVKNVKKT